MPARLCSDHPQPILIKMLMYISNAAAPSTAPKIRLFTRPLFIRCSPFIREFALRCRVQEGRLRLHVHRLQRPIQDTYTAQLRKKILFMRFFSC